MTIQMNENGGKFIIQISENNKQLFISAIELKINALEKIKKNCFKENQMKAANELQPDILLLTNLLNRLKPWKPTPLPLKLS